jgi:hypothetical protein
MGNETPARPPESRSQSQSASDGLRARGFTPKLRSPLPQRRLQSWRMKTRGSRQIAEGTDR